MAKTEKAAQGAVPEFLAGAIPDMKGFEQISSQTMAIPFIRLLQPGSPQVKKKDPTYVEGAEEGNWFNTLTKAVLGDMIRVVVLKFDRMFIEWRPDRQGLAGYHTPENAERIATTKEFGNWRTANGNILAETYIYMVLVLGHEAEGPAVISLSSSAIKIAKEWNRLMVTQIMDDGRRAAPYFLVWELGVEYVTNEKGSWYKPRVRLTLERYVTQKQFATVEEERKQLPMRQIDMKQLEDAHETAPQTGADSGF